MSVNKYKDHVLVLPEDDANAQIANGFLLERAVKAKNLQILPPARGWTAIGESFERVHNEEMKRYPRRHMVVLVDFDDRGEQRLTDVLSRIDPAVRGRVAVFGVSSEPERLRAACGSYESIGKALAKDCAEGTDAAWSHELLEHNRPELARAMVLLRPILF